MTDLELYILVHQDFQLEANRGNGLDLRTQSPKACRGGREERGRERSVEASVRKTDPTFNTLTDTDLLRALKFVKNCRLSCIVQTDDDDAALFGAKERVEDLGEEDAHGGSFSPPISKNYGRSRLQTFAQPDPPALDARLTTGFLLLPRMMRSLATSVISK